MSNMAVEPEVMEHDPESNECNDTKVKEVFHIILCKNRNQDSF